MNKSKQTTAPDLSPTSSLPFAARGSDVDYLDLVENGSKPAIDKLAKRIGNGAPAVLFAELTNDTNLQLQGLLDVLKSVQDYLKLAHRGGAALGMTSEGCFHRARSMLAVVVDQVEVMTDSAGSYLDDFCESESSESTA